MVRLDIWDPFEYWSGDVIQRNCEKFQPSFLTVMETDMLTE